MGTSSSSVGPGKGVPMVPPWVPSLPDEDQVPPVETPSDPAAPTPPPAVPEQTPLAPSNRFNAARRNLAKFAANSNSGNLRRGVGHYFSKGYGGGGGAARRFGGTARTAGSLFGALSPGGGGGARSPERDAFEQACRTSGSPEAIVTALVEILRPIDGTQDAEAERKSLAEAFSEFLRQFPNADILNLTNAQRMDIVSRYVSLDVYRRFFLDVGKTIIDRAPTIATGVARVREAKEYIVETVKAAFGKLVTDAGTLTSQRVVSLVTTTLKDSIEVFQSYTE